MKLLPKFQPGGIIRRDGDPYEYTKLSNGKVAYRNKGSNEPWSTPSSQRSTQAINDLFGQQGNSIFKINSPFDLTKSQTPSRSYAPMLPMYKKDSTVATQRFLQSKGYKIADDGAWGPKTQAAYDDWNKKQQAKPITTGHEKSVTDYLNDITGAVKKGVEVAVSPVTESLKYVGTKVRDYASSHSSGIVGQAAPFVSDILGLKTPMTEKSFTPAELALFKTIKDNPNNPNIKEFKTKDSKGKSIIIPADKRRQNTEAHFMYYAENGTPEQKEAARSLMNKIGQGTVANIGTDQPIDYYNFNKSVNDSFSNIDKAKELIRRPGEDEISYGKRIGTRVIGPMLGTTGTAENDKVGQPTILSTIKKGGLIKRKK